MVKSEVFRLSWCRGYDFDQLILTASVPKTWALESDMYGYLKMA